ncbi:DNA-binding transcriptional regulator, XRE-family HTH domain [Alteribacillus persepolensis]|uniref:DNA-binding transcriptional regulator, XRE-family HTH domain n=1 Tax=Alteribacillus persepolensis TaxID=568899 RepID=A0A1G8IG07_9BACI|nr:helix-turn-helix transcriptional regulator [Alteribacillus persepolensis]SDI17835.1 DNA-binding transcriptional regulator, XRE-family HTH domain [Alteribacillus persepolensis]
MRDWLKEIRRQRGYTQEKVAELSNIQRAYYTMIESGNRNPSVSAAKAIGSALGFDWTIFFENKRNETKQNTTSAS